MKNHRTFFQVPKIINSGLHYVFLSINVLGIKMLFCTNSTNIEFLPINAHTLLRFSRRNKQICITVNMQYYTHLCSLPCRDGRGTGTSSVKTTSGRKSSSVTPGLVDTSGLVISWCWGAYCDSGNTLGCATVASWVSSWVWDAGCGGSWSELGRLTNTFRLRSPSSRSDGSWSRMITAW